MTSTNDGKDVKSNQISGPKSKTYFIELYKSLDGRLSGECSGEERARLVCQSWRRVHSLCQHSAPTTQLHLINWLQQHTAHTILQTEWQLPKSKQQHTLLEQAIDEFIQECQNAKSKREGGWSPPWEQQLKLRALWFRSTLSNPWGHSVLKALLDSKGTQPSDNEILEWLKLERGVMFVTRLRQLAASKCDDLALLLATTLMDKMRAATVIVSDVEQAEARDNPVLLNNKESTFVNILREEAGFTEEVWMLITDIEFVLLYKGELRSRCIELAKGTPLRNGYQLVKRLHGRLEKSPRDKKLWKNAKDAATLVAQVVIARCMVVPLCVGSVRGALAGCAGLLALLLEPKRLRTAAAALAAPAATSRHLYTLAEAVHDRCKDERTSFVCELYVRAITAGMNELERLKIKTEKESEARATEKTLSSWFSKLGGLLSASPRLYCECILTAFSVHPSPAMYERVQAAPPLAPFKTDIQEIKEEANSEYGSWATDSRTQTNFVKTSETLNLKKTQKQANVLSTAIFAEGEALALGAELCQDLAVLISGPRVKTLSWDMDREQLLESCLVYCERTRGGTRALTTELRFLNLDPSCFQHLPEECDDDGDLYYGIEKGYEHLVDVQEPEEIWKDAVSDDVGKSDNASTDSPLVLPRRKQIKTKPLKYSSDEDSDSLSLDAISKSGDKKERPHSKERSKERKESKHKTKVKLKPKDESEETISGIEIPKKKKERKERKKKEKEKDTLLKIARPGGSLSRLVGMKVAGLSNLNSTVERRIDGNLCITDSDYDSQGKSSIASLNSEGNDPDVLFDGLFSMEDIKLPEKCVSDNIQRANMSKMDELSLCSGAAIKYHRNTPLTSYQNPLLSANVNHVKEDVKNSIKKLIEFRRYKNINNEQLIRADVNTQRFVYEQQPSQNNVPVPALNTQNVSNTPKVIIHRGHIQLNSLKDEVNNVLKKTPFDRDTNCLNEKLISPNTITIRPTERAKKPGNKISACSLINQRGLLETVKRATECNQNKHQEIIRHLEKTPNIINFQDTSKIIPLSITGQSLEKTEVVSQNMYQSTPQHISNTSPSLPHTKVVNTDKKVGQISHQYSLNLPQQQHRHDSSQQQFHSFLKDLQVSINAGASKDKVDAKVSPTQQCSKQTIQQKKPENVPNTFARMSYLKNKQTDLKSKCMDKTIKNKCIHGAPVDNLQHLNSKGELYISKVDKIKSQMCKERDKIKLENRDNKSIVKIEMFDVMNSCKSSTAPLSIVKKHPTMSNILSNGSQKQIPTTLNDINLKCNEKIQSIVPERTSFLSEKDQDDMLKLLRQQSLLNSTKGKHKTEIPKSSVDSVTLSNNRTLIVNPDRRPSFSANNVKINKSTSEPKINNNKSPPTPGLKVSNTKPPSASHSKKRNAKETNKCTKDSPKNSDWESVMNALLATKTPTRVSQSGPNALDIALNKDSFDRCYTSNPNAQNEKKIHSSVITETIKSKPAISVREPVSDIVGTSASKNVTKCEIKSKNKESLSISKPQTITRLLPVSKPVFKQKPIIVETHLESSKRHTFHGQGKPLPSVIQNRDDPFISGIKNSDYDLLEELMDDDLRQEIGELSDEELYNVPMLNSTKYKNTINTTSHIMKKHSPILNKNLYVQPQRSTYKVNNFKYKDTECCQNDLKNVGQEKKCTQSSKTADTKPRIISNEVILPANIHNNITYYPVINNVTPAFRDSNDIKNNFNLTSPMTSINPDSTIKIDSQTTNPNNNKVQSSRLNILDPARVVLTVPPRNTQSNVMLIGDKFIYDSFSTIHDNASNYNPNTYIAVNQVPKVTLYHTTQFATPVLNPVVIENSIVSPAPKDTNKITPEVAQLTSRSIIKGDMRDNMISPNKIKKELVNDIPVIKQTISMSSNELLSNLTNEKRIHKDKAHPSFLERDSSLKISSKSNSTEIVRKPHKHSKWCGGKNKSSVSHIPTSVIVSSDNHGTNNSTHLKKEKPSTCFQNVITDISSQKAKIVREDSINKVAPELCHVKDISEKTDLKISQTEDIAKQSKLDNHHHERIYKKRLRILSREIEHRCHHNTIALPYEPIRKAKNLNVENYLQVPSITARKDIELPKQTCRRILLRSSNSLKLTKSIKTATLVNKSKRKHFGVKMVKDHLKVQHDTKSSKKFRRDFQKTNTTETCDMKEYLNPVHKPILEGVVENKEDEMKTRSIGNENNESKIDPHDPCSVKKYIEPSEIPALQTKEIALPIRKEFVESSTQDRHPDSIKEYNEIDCSKVLEVPLKKPEDRSELDGPGQVQSKEVQAISSSLKDRICTNNNKVIKIVNDKSSIEKKLKIKDELEDKISFEELPNLDNDQSKRYIRIKLPNGTFKATISGKVNVNVDSILEDPYIKSMLWEKMNCNTKCILNIKQIAVQSKNRPSVVKTQIQDVSYVIKDDIETINLISDDDEDSMQHFETEFGSFKIAKIDANLFSNHQKKFTQKSEVKIERSKLKENTTNKLIPYETTCDVSLDIPKKIVDYIEIDDSSNESVNLMSTLDFTIIKKFEVEEKSSENVSILNDHILNDCVSNNTGQNKNGNESEMVNSKMSETFESIQTVSEFEIKDCSLKIEKCDKLITQYEQLKIKNKKCFVNLVRCDRNKSEDFTEIKLAEKSKRFSYILNADDELGEICERSIKRSDSTSILNDLSTPDSDVSRVSPSVLEEFDMCTTFRESTNIFDDLNSVIDFLPLNCLADWLMTKSKIHCTGPETNTPKVITFGLEKSSFTLDEISTDCDSDIENNPAFDETYYEEDFCNQKRNIFQAPSLLKIIVDFFANNIHIIENLKHARKISKHVSLPPSLKRKSSDFKHNKSPNKILKLANESTLMKSHHNINELLTKQEDKSFMSPKHNSDNIKNIRGSFDNRIDNLEVKAAPTKLVNQDENYENNNEKYPSDINIDNLRSMTKYTSINNIKRQKNDVTNPDVILTENKSNKTQIDVPAQECNDDYCKTLIQSNTNNIKLRMDKKYDSQSSCIKDGSMNGENESYNTSLTLTTLEYSLHENIDIILNDTKIKADIIDSNLNKGVKFKNPLVPQNDNQLSIADKENIHLLVDMKQKSPDDSNAYNLPEEVKKSINEDDTKLDININYSSSSENSNLLSLVIKTGQKIENEFNIPRSLQKLGTETISDAPSGCDYVFNENSKVCVPLEEVNDDILKKGNINNSPSSSKICDLSYKENFNCSDSPDISSNQFNSDKTENATFEEIKNPNIYENVLENTNYDHSETTVKINNTCLNDNKDMDKDTISNILPEETLKTVEIKPVRLLEEPEIITMDSVENIISENYENEVCNMKTIEIENNNSDIDGIDLAKNKTRYDDSEKQIISVMTGMELHNDQTKNKYMSTLTQDHDVHKKEINIIINENNVVEKEASDLNEMNEIDLNQKHILDVLNKISGDRVDYMKTIKYDNNISNEKPKQKNVTLVYKGDSGVVLKGSIYEDPVVGTCYVFPILNRSFLPEDILSNVSNDRCISVLQHLKDEINEDKIDEELVKFSALPKITYLRGRLKDVDDPNETNVKKNRRNLKRKIDFNDKQNGKKYRKGKNIDCPKFTSTAVNDFAYSKEYKRIFDYCNSITFSYSRPFHIEHIDVSTLLKSWPINGITVDNTDQTDFKNLLFIDEDIYQVPYDPLQQTFSEEISNCNDQQYISSNIIENNFSMGFGEESDRVIHISKDEDNYSKFSAATLSDVKQAQPFLMSSHYETKIKRPQELESYKEQKDVFKRYLTYIQLKEKVRSFFKNTTIELNNSWLTDNKIKSNIKNRFPYELTCPDYIRPVPFQCVVQVVQVGQLPVSAAQNPVTCDPRVTQVTDASPSQCSGENSPHDSQSPIKTEYTELTTADISLPLVQEYERHIEAQESSKALVSLDNIPVETEIKTEIKDEIPDFENDQNDCNENNVLQTLVTKHINNIEYPYESTDCSETLHTQTNSEPIYEQELYNNCDFLPEQKQHDIPPEKTDQIAHAMNAAGITTTSESMSNTKVNVMSQNICEEVADDPSSPNNMSKAINSMTLQQALAQILPPPLNPTTQENNQSSTNSSLTSQVLHIVQGKNSNSNQITLLDNPQNSVISNSNTPMLHIVQNKGSHTNSTSNTNVGQQNNSFGGLNIVDSGLQQGNNQLLHIVNTGTQKNSSTGQLLKRVNLLTNLTNSQGSNEQKMVQFVCKSADGKSIQLNSSHQRSMVLRLHPIESNIQNGPKPTDSQELSPVSNGNNSSPVKEATNTQHEIKSRSIYEENYAKFIQSSNKSVPEKSTTLPKFNQAFGKQVFQDNNQKANDLNSNTSHLSINSSTESSECQGTDNAINIDHIGQISSPPLLLRKSPAQTSQAQSNLVQQIKQTIAPMNIQTMHGGVIYTRQIPVNIGGGQTINLITVPSTDLLDNDNQKQQGEVKFINQNDIESPIIKIVPHSQNNSSVDGSTDDSNSHIGITNENGQSTPTQHQPVLTQMRIKLPMLSKTPQMVSGTRVVRPSFFQIQRNVIGGANQPVYQQLVLTAAPPLSQHIRLPQSQTTRQVKVSSDGQSSSESQMSTSTLEQLREFDMVLEQVKERSTVQPTTIPNNAFAKLHGSSSDTTDSSSVTSTVTESTQQVLYSIGNNQSLNVAYVNRKPNTTFVRSPDSSGIIDSPSSSTHIQIPHTVTTESASNDVSTQPNQPKAAKVGSKSKSRSKSSNSSNSMKINAVPPKTSTQKPLEDEQTTQRILYILAEYKEQVENSPDKDKPAPRRRSNPPSNPGSSKRKKSSSGSRRSGMRDMSPVHGEDTCRTMGSEDSSCGTSLGDCNDSCMDSHSPQDSPRKVVRKLTFDGETSTTASQPRPQPQRNVIVADGQTITVARGASGKPTTAVLMPANYILPVSMVKGGQQIAIVTNRGPKILTVGGGEGGTTNALLLQRLIGPAGLKPVLTRPGVRHVRLPTAALHNLQAFNLATATFQPPDSTASPAPGSTPPELIETRTTGSPWTDRDSEVKPERGSSPEDTEPWNLPSSADPHDYSYEETVRTDNMDRTVLVVQRRDGSRHHRFAHVTHAAAMRHKYAILEHELRLQGSIFSQKSLSEECEDLGVDSPSASELFPEAELLFGNSPAHDAQHNSHTPQPTVLSQCGIPQPDLDDQIATDHLLQHDGLDDQQDLGVTLGLDEGIVTVSEDGMQATIALDQEEFARSHPNTTFHSEPTEDGEIQPFIMTGLKGRHITSTVFHATRAPATVLVSAPASAVPSHPPADLVLTDTRELHLSGHATQVIRRVCWDRREGRFSVDEAGRLAANDDAKMSAEDAAPETPPGDDDASSPERHAELFWESNSTSERSEGRRPPDFSSDSEKCCKSPSYDETNSTDSSGVGAHVRLDSVIKDARGIELSGSADGSSADDALPPVRTYPAKRHHGHEEERSVSGKTRAGEGEGGMRRRASGRGVVKRGCQCCGGSPAPLRPKKARQRKPAADSASN